MLDLCLLGFFLYTSRIGLVIFFPAITLFSFFPQVLFTFLCCRQMLQHKRWEQAPVQLTIGSTMPRKMLGKEERDTSQVECYGFAKSISSRESANPNLKTSGGSCRITTYCVPMLINHKVKKNPIFLLPTLNMLASATRFGFLGFSAVVVWNPLVPYDFFLLSFLEGEMEMKTSLGLFFSTTYT